MTKRQYRKELKDPRWIIRRCEKIISAGGMCERDQSTEKLNVHHTAYIEGRHAWEYSNDELELLCRKCHRDEHRMKVVRRQRRSVSKCSFGGCLVAAELVNGHSHAADTQMPWWRGRALQADKDIEDLRDRAVKAIDEVSQGWDKLYREATERLEKSRDFWREDADTWRKLCMVAARAASYAPDEQRRAYLSETMEIQGMPVEDFVTMQNSGSNGTCH